ncbi:MAG: class I SAM-dependent methyltransferase [Frankiaceae bacterium]
MKREIDWFAWHRLYDDPTSKRAKRLERMQSAVLQALESVSSGPVELLSVCAGQGREISGALERFSRPREVNVRMIELDPRNAACAETAVRAAGSGRVEVTIDDAGLRRHYAGGARVDVLLLCGVFGNLTLDDIERSVVLADSLLSAGGLVVWTRHRAEPDRVPLIRSWFAGHGFTEAHVDDDPDAVAVVVNRSTRERGPLPDGDRMFTYHSGVPSLARLRRPA